MNGAAQWGRKAASQRERCTTLRLWSTWWWLVPSQARGKWDSHQRKLWVGHATPSRGLSNPEHQAWASSRSHRWPTRGMHTLSCGVRPRIACPDSQGTVVPRHCGSRRCAYGWTWRKLNMCEPKMQLEQSADMALSFAADSLACAAQQRCELVASAPSNISATQKAPSDATCHGPWSSWDAFLLFIYIILLSVFCYHYSILINFKHDYFLLIVFWLLIWI